MKKNMLKGNIVLLLWVVSLLLSAQIPAGYYEGARGKSGAELKTALHNIIKDPKVLSYGSGVNSTWYGFTKTDVRPEDGTVWDMYSNNHVEFNGNSAAAGMNIEHSFAKSWWGGAKRTAYRDLHHLNPSNQQANSAKGSWPMAYVTGKKTFDNGVIKVGKSNNRPGGEISAWEPADEYKGDFARAYMYMVTCYEDYASDWTGNSVNQLDNNTYPVFEQWTVDLLLKWNREDPVSEKEKTRNEAVFSLQKNRNPYIDFPDLAEYVWGDRKNESFDPDAGSSPAIIHPVDGSIVDLGINTVNSQLSYMLNIKARNLKGDISLSVTDNHFSVSRSVLTKDEAEKGANVKLTCDLADVLKYSGTLIITGGGLENVVSISLKAQAVSSIPALPAMDITSEGFLARWVHLPSIKEVTLHVYTRDGDKILPLDGYPRQCFSEDQEARVTGISYDTTYYYRVTSGDMGSNEISVFIPAPVPMISVASLDGDLNFSTEPSIASETKRVNITGKYTYEQIHVMVDEPFEISVDNREWFRQIDLSSAGGTVWVRLSDSAAEGEHVSELLVSSEEIEEEEILPLSGLVAVKKAFFEDFETGSKGSYASGVVTCSKGRWLFDDALMGAQNGDLKQGKKSARIRNGYIEMQDDKAGGIGTLSLYAGLYGSDTNGKLSIWYSSDSGVSWNLIAENIALTKTLTKYIYTVNVSGNLRVKIENTGGNRINVDDIEMSDYRVSGVDDISTSAVKVGALNGVLWIEAPEKSSYSIYDINGVLVRTVAVINRTEVYGLPLGTYIISGKNVNGGVKILVR